MEPYEIKHVATGNLLINLSNPRFDPQGSQLEALSHTARDQDEKLVNLAEDMVENGLNPSELLIVTPASETGFYTVLEGNRRLAALRILQSPSLLASLGLPERLERRYTELSQADLSSLPRVIDCAVFPTTDSARHWMELRHTGENAGVGIVSWSGAAAQRFRGGSLASQAIDLVSHRGYLDEATMRLLPKIAITNIDRVLKTPLARQEIEVDVNNGRLSLNGDETVVLQRLATIVTDVAQKRIKVTQLDSQRQRIEYARDVVARAQPSENPPRGTAEQVTPTPPTVVSRRRQVPPNRTSLIPKQLKIQIDHVRINRIYHELQGLTLDPFVNAGSVLLRVFLELSLDDFGQRRQISFLKPGRARASQRVQQKEMTLREKIRTVADFLEANSYCTKRELRGIRSIANNKEHFLSVESLNAYVHDKDFNPIGSELKATWDNIQISVERVWTV